MLSAGRSYARHGLQERATMHIVEARHTVGSVIQMSGR
jgi:hypothetical protein